MVSSSRKRGREQMETEAVEAPREPTLLDRIRSTWEFANLAQWIFTFGKAVKIDEAWSDIEELEMECLKHNSPVLPEIGLALLKFVSSHRGLTPEIFDEYTRRQYVAKAPHRNPFGTEEEPAKYTEFDIFMKIRVLQQLTQWTMGNPDRIRERMEEQKDSEQTIWRIEPFGWDSDERTYFLLDDNRLYRRTDPPPPKPAAKPKKGSKKAKAALRASKRRKISEPAESEAEPQEEDDAGNDDAVEKEDDGFGGMKWECLAITFDEVNAFIASIEKSRDPNEKILCKEIKSVLLPLLEKQEESRKRKAAQKERELLNLEKLATAKRSSRIAGKMEHQKQEEEARESERKKIADLAMAKKEQEKWVKLEKERESRMMTREQRVKEREARRILHEEELANLSEDSKKIESGAGRLSERHLKAEIERKKHALEELAEEEDWIFDCICGAYGQIDDGTHSIACEKCNIWQHSKCVGVSQAEAERDDFHFVCSTCQRRARDEERAKTHPPIKITIKRPGSSSMATTPNVKPNGYPAILPPHAAISQSPQKPAQQAYWHTTYQPQQVAVVIPSASNGTPKASEPPRPVVPGSTPNRNVDERSPVARQSQYGNTVGGPQYTPHSAPRPSSSHAFSSPRHDSPTSLPPPTQPQAYTFANGNALSYANYDARMPNNSVQPTSTRPYPSQASPSPFSQPEPYSSQRPLNGQAPAPNEFHRRGSMNFPSPAPVLTPAKAYNSPFAPSSSPPNHPTPSMPTKFNFAPPHVASSPIPLAVEPQTHTSVLPPVSTGYSPTKHSPPRPTTSNGSFGSATPSMLPPVASLSPSPRLQNLSPPVKPSEPDRPRSVTST